MSKIERKTIKFYGAPEKRTRYHLGLGSSTTIGIAEMLRIAKIHNYIVELVNSGHWKFNGSMYYQVFAGESKYGTRNYYYDVGFDSVGSVTDIFGGYSTDADYGLGQFLAYVFNINKARDKRQAVWAERRNQSIKFPCNKEKKIRETLGLAETQHFEKTELMDLALLHGYKVRGDEKGASNEIDLYPVPSVPKKLKQHFRMIVGDNDKVESIKEISLA